MNQPIFQPILIQEVTFTGAVIDGDAEPEYKPDLFINLCFMQRMKPTKRKEVLAITVAGEVSYVLRKDFEQHSRQSPNGSFSA